MAAETIYISHRVLEQVDNNRRTYEDAGDYDGAKLAEDLFFEAVARIKARPEKGVHISLLPPTHRRVFIEKYRCYIYYRTNQEDGNILIIWIKWDGQGRSNNESTLRGEAMDTAERKWADRQLIVGGEILAAHNRDYTEGCDHC